MVEQYGDSLTIIRYYVSPHDDPFYEFNPVEIDARKDYCGSGYTPHLYIDGYIDAGSMFDAWDDTIINRFAVESPLEIGISGTYDDVSREATLDVSITATDTIIFVDLRFQCALVENGILFIAPNGQKYHSQVMRDMVPDAEGEPIFIGLGETVHFYRTFSLDSILVDDSCEIVVFVQSQNTKYVLQSNKITIPQLSPPPPLSVQMIPENPPIIVPAGGQFEFTGILANRADQPQTTDVWIMLAVPGIGIFGPIQQFHNIALAPYDTITAPNIIQYVPAYAPLGTYQYIAYCGDYPSLPIDSASLLFEVTGLAGAKSATEEWTMVEWFSDGKSPEATLQAAPSIHCYPNPSNAKVNIIINSLVDAPGSLEVYDIAGRKVATLLENSMLRVTDNLTWDMSEFPSGIYFLKLKFNYFSESYRLVLLK